MVGCHINTEFFFLRSLRIAGVGYTWPSSASGLGFSFALWTLPRMQPKQKNTKALCFLFGLSLLPLTGFYLTLLSLDNRQTSEGRWVFQSTVLCQRSLWCWVIEASSSLPARTGCGIAFSSEQTEIYQPLCISLISPCFLRKKKKTDDAVNWLRLGHFLLI